MPRDPWSHVPRSTLFLDQSLKSKQLGTFVTILLVTLIVGCKATGQPMPEPLATDVLDEVPGRIPLKAFASLPLVHRMKLSPSGEHVASIQNTAEGKTYLVVTTYDGKDVRRLLKSDNKRYSVRWFD